MMMVALTGITANIIEMIQFQNIRSLAEFQEGPRAFIERLKDTGRPELLTVEGSGEVVVQDVAAYRRLLERLDEAEAVAGIRRGVESMEAGRGRPYREALGEIAQRHGIVLPE